MEDMLYEIESVRRFAGLRLTGPLPDETTVLNFRHLLERHGLGVVCSRRSTRTWRSGATGCGRGRSWTRASSRRVIDEEPGGGAGSGDASDEEGQRVALRDEGAHRGGRGDGTGAWRAGDAGEHARIFGRRGRCFTAARRRCGRTRATGGIEKWVDTGGRPVQWHVAMRPGRRRLLEQGGARWLRERDKASVRAKVEHPFLYVKRRFGYRKVRYRGLAKNIERIALLLGFANLLVAGRYSTA